MRRLISGIQLPPLVARIALHIVAVAAHREVLTVIEFARQRHQARARVRRQGDVRCGARNVI